MTSGTWLICQNLEFLIQQILLSDRQSWFLIWLLPFLILTRQLPNIVMFFNRNPQLDLITLWWHSGWDLKIALISYNVQMKFLLQQIINSKKKKKKKIGIFLFCFPILSNFFYRCSMRQLDIIQFKSDFWRVCDICCDKRLLYEKMDYETSGFSRLFIYAEATNKCIAVLGFPENCENIQKISKQNC